LKPGGKCYDTTCVAKSTAFSDEMLSKCFLQAIVYNYWYAVSFAQFDISVLFCCFLHKCFGNVPCSFLQCFLYKSEEYSCWRSYNTWVTRSCVAKARGYMTIIEPKFSKTCLLLGTTSYNHSPQKISGGCVPAAAPLSCTPFTVTGCRQHWVVRLDLLGRKQRMSIFFFHTLAYISAALFQRFKTSYTPRPLLHTRNSDFSAPIPTQPQHSHSIHANFRVAIRDRPIWLFWGRYQYIGHSWADSR